MHKIKATKVLEDWDDVCEELKITHFLIYGTCLGFHREGDFIPFDNDIDVRVMCNQDKWHKLIEQLASRGILQGSNPAGYVFSRDSISLNIERSEKVGTMIHDDGNEWPTLPLYHTLDTVEYNGREYKMPHPVEEYLKKRYGKDWKIPDPDWDNKKSGGA